MPHGVEAALDAAIDALPALGFGRREDGRRLL